MTIPNIPEPSVTIARPSQNGVTRPSENTKTGYVWAVCDHMSNEADRPIALSEVISVLTEKGINEATIRTQYAYWRKFNGVTGRIVSPEVAEAKEKANAEKEAKKAEREAERARKLEEKEAKKAQRDAEREAAAKAKAEEKARKDAERAEKAAKKEAEKQAREEEKARKVAEDAAKKASQAAEAAAKIEAAKETKNATDDE